jgi:hypothetical protein
LWNGRETRDVKKRTYAQRNIEKRVIFETSVPNLIVSLSQIRLFRRRDHDCGYGNAGLVSLRRHGGFGGDRKGDGACCESHGGVNKVALQRQRVPRCGGVQTRRRQGFATTKPSVYHPYLSVVIPSFTKAFFLCLIYFLLIFRAVAVVGCRRAAAVAHVGGGRYRGEQHDKRRYYGVQVGSGGCVG